MHTSSPSLIFFPFPISTTENSFLTKAPQPDPLGYLTAAGPECSKQVFRRTLVSFSSDGMAITRFGIQRIKLTSKLPECVGPSSPTMPALSKANVTSIFSRHTS